MFDNKNLHPKLIKLYLVFRIQLQNFYLISQNDEGSEVLKQNLLFMWKAVKFWYNLR